MTFTIIEICCGRATSYTEDIETLDELFSIGHDRFGDAPMTINWETMTIVVQLY